VPEFRLEPTFHGNQEGEPALQNSVQNNKAADGGDWRWGEGGKKIGAWMTYLTMSGDGIWTAKVEKWRCILGVMLNDPARGFMQAQYCTLVTSLKTTLPCTRGGRVSKGCEGAVGL